MTVKKNIDELYNDVESRYDLVIAIAKRARLLSQIREDNNEPETEKPVITVLNDLLAGRLVVKSGTEDCDDETLFDENIYEDIGDIDIVDYTEDSSDNVIE